MRTTALIVCMAAASTLFGCGPIVSGVQVVKANIAISAAETAGAPKNAIYEYTAAVEYLKKAREEAGYSDYSASRTYADKALDYAIRAREKAEALSSVDQPVVLPTPQ